MFIFFLVVFSVQVIFFALFIGAFLRKQKYVVQTDTQPVSVVVCAHDEEENLRELLPVLLGQSHPQFEVIIVNDRSNDNTYDFMREEMAKDSRLRMVNVDHLPPHADAKKYGITLAIKAAKHDIILLTDADCRPASTSWISSMSNEFEADTNFVLGVSPYEKESSFLNLFIRFETLFTGLQYIAFAKLGIPYMGVGRNLAYRKSLFLKVKGFNELLSIKGGDDDLLVNRHATKSTTGISIGNESLTFSKPKKTWTEFFSQKVRHLSVGKRYKLQHRILLGLFMFTFLTSWIFGLTLISVTAELVWVISALTFRMALFTTAVYLASKRFGHKFDIWAVPFLDILFVFYYISTGTVALVTKKVRWKT